MTLLLLSLLLPDAEARSAGITGQSTAGCTCHGSSADSTTSATFSASTNTVAAGDSLLVSFVVATTSGSRSKGGLNVSASGGTLAAGSNDRLSGGQITHSSATNMTSGSVTYTMTWTAPTTPGTYTLYGAGNAVNGNGASSGDGWNLGTYAITVTAPCTDVDGDGYTAGGSNCGGDCNDSVA
ncbi:MAG TPA: hypothetical protein PKW90_28215, partial [Myxococcota bacterium]|nr:hypothetical protein [Myxococcota bacterium]